MSEKRKAVFIDKDGTIIPDVPYNVDPSLISLHKGVIEGLKLLKEQGFLLIVISNQAGVARGYFKEADLAGVKSKLNELIKDADFQLDGFYYCPHHPDGKIPEYAISCDCRKPRPGMILRAAADFNIDTAQSWMVGDILNDVEAGNRAGCRTIIIDNGGETEWVTTPERKPDFVVGSFLQAAEVIAANTYKTLNVNDKWLAGL